MRKGEQPSWIVSAVRAGELVRPLRIGRDLPHQQRVDVRQRGLEQMRCEHADLLGLPVLSGQVAVLAAEEVLFAGFRFSTTRRPSWISWRSPTSARQSQTNADGELRFASGAVCGRVGYA
ncbi:hypothetical protein ACIBCT_17550 [Streptosporangium sp. NPDC050855]|uniref:hypothetical protein n=1 Tax=Streptosporangium sp. NPDC050855 TaxID=3366194 RepID=UPI0037892DD8